MSVRQIYGNILSLSDVDAICHQVNCLTVSSRSLSLQLAHKYPWADIYETRRPMGKRNMATPETRGTPGTLSLFTRPRCPTVVCFLSQWDFGRCQNVRKRKIPPFIDTTENRREWFQSHGSLWHGSVGPDPPGTGCALRWLIRRYDVECRAPVRRARPSRQREMNPSPPGDVEMGGIEDTDINMVNPSTIPPRSPIQTRSKTGQK
ncbi:uncharacterized protein LOC130050083 isoform X2 [Ostrea edulis]|uniref:uncharacterized protein LOC130050083 isoform X1 n=1 Tax=Ostrea edulis TaxID=37623 RepID=UPI0024AFD106|nr:uncharacterized protein LOC130050083 isoform X1 [Ostrea edulis]XP_056004764.1 uncharacterized protein LOC130050083 isoform X2 [Ostrea edulis]